MSDSPKPPSRNPASQDADAPKVASDAAVDAEIAGGDLLTLDAAFLPRLVHELSSPTNSIHCFLGLLAKSNDSEQLSESAREALHVIANSADDLRLLMRSVARYAHSMDRKFVTPLELERIVLEAWNKVLHDYQLSDEPKLELDCEAVDLLGDDYAMQFALQCLFDNALKFRSSRRPLLVRIEGRQLDAEYQLTIQDNGIGVEPKYTQRCFLPFERLHPRRSYGGAGLGIPTAVNCLKHMGGTLQLDSDGSCGTTVTMRFPQAARPIE